MFKNNEERVFIHNINAPYGAFIFNFVVVARTGFEPVTSGL